VLSARAVVVAGKGRYVVVRVDWVSGAKEEGGGKGVDMKVERMERSSGVDRAGEEGRAEGRTKSENRGMGRGRMCSIRRSWREGRSMNWWGR
jgi:hypothetical protein